MTLAVQREPPSTDPLFGGGSSRGVDGVAEKLDMVSWGIDKGVCMTSPVLSFTSLILSLPVDWRESWETPDPTTFVFHIRPGVHWHDKAPMNGRELTAQDIEYNFHRVWGLGSGFTAPHESYSGSLNRIPVESVTATDSNTVILELKQPQLGALQPILVDTGAFVLPPEVIQQHGDLRDWRNLVGTGPLC